MSYIEIHGETDDWFDTLTEEEKRWVDLEVDRIHALPECYRAWMEGSMRARISNYRILKPIGIALEKANIHTFKLHKSL